MIWNFEEMIKALKYAKTAKMLAMLFGINDRFLYKFPWVYFLSKNCFKQPQTEWFPHCFYSYQNTKDVNSNWHLFYPSDCKSITRIFIKKVSFIYLKLRKHIIHMDLFLFFSNDDWVDSITSYDFQIRSTLNFYG